MRMGCLSSITKVNSKPNWSLRVLDTAGAVPWAEEAMEVMDVVDAVTEVERDEDSAVSRAVILPSPG